MARAGLISWLAACKQRLLKGREDKLEKELIRLTREDVAQRLIQLEQEKNPQASRRSHIESAIWRYKKDQR